MLTGLAAWPQVACYSLDDLVAAMPEALLAAHPPRTRPHPPRTCPGRVRGSAPQAPKVVVDDGAGGAGRAAASANAASGAAAPPPRDEKARAAKLDPSTYPMARHSRDTAETQRRHGRGVAQRWRDGVRTVHCTRWRRGGLCGAEACRSEACWRECRSTTSSRRTRSGSCSPRCQTRLAGRRRVPPPRRDWPEIASSGAGRRLPRRSRTAAASSSSCPATRRSRSATRPSSGACSPPPPARASSSSSCTRCSTTPRSRRRSRRRPPAPSRCSSPPPPLGEARRVRASISARFRRHLGGGHDLGEISRAGPCRPR